MKFRKDYSYVDSLEGLERKRTYAEVLSKVVTDTVVVQIQSPKIPIKIKLWNRMFVMPIIFCVGKIRQL